jgi:hypothetical protein
MSKLICAWCKRVMNNNYPTDGDSHGICPECLEREMGEGSAVIGGQVVKLQSPAACVEAVADEMARMGVTTGGLE